ncbi:MAG: TspO/MBR family protein [Candidatus Nanoarchaeia archaeon]|jgi:tryptophan-rich sensory protein
MNYSKVLRNLQYLFFISSIIVFASWFFVKFSQGNYVASPFSPPQWLFFPMWSFLFFMIGLSLRELSNKGFSNAKLNFAFWIFVIQMLINFLWGSTFVLLNSLIISAVILLFAWFFVLFSFVEFKELSKKSAYLLLPYLCWMTAAVLVSLGNAWVN